jgi:chemotaxis protein MotB
MARRRAHVEEPEHENAERWLVSYADMITLLAALFIVLFAMSRLDLAKFAKFAHALNNSLGSGSTASNKPSVLDGSGDKPTQGGTGMLDGTSASSQTQASSAAATDTPNPDESFDKTLADKLSPTSATGKERQALTAIQQQIYQSLVAAGLGNAVTFRLDDRGLVVQIVTDHVLFNSGSAALQTEGEAILNGLAAPLTAQTHRVEVDGYTDSQPIHSGIYPSNDALSFARATSVVRYLVDADGFPAPRISAVGYGEQNPVAPNDTRDGRAKNRRVEIVILADPTATASTGSTTAAGSTTSQ